MYTYIFLDVDGVLNNAHTKGLKVGFAWLDDNNIRVFKNFVEFCYSKYGHDNVRIVLISSWRKNNFAIKSKGLRGVLDARLKKEGLAIDVETEKIDTW